MCYLWSGVTWDICLWSQIGGNVIWVRFKKEAPAPSPWASALTPGTVTPLTMTALGWVFTLLMALYPFNFAFYSASIISRQDWGAVLLGIWLEWNWGDDEREGLGFLFISVYTHVFSMSWSFRFWSWICNKISSCLNWHSAQLLWCPFLIFRFPGRSLD